MNAPLALFWKHSALALMVGIVGMIFALFAFDSGGMPEIGKTDFAPYVLCTEGTTVVKRSEDRITLPKEKTAEIVSGDQIKTLPNSSATVFWADGSITRLAEKTTIDVNELSGVSKTAELRVDFSLTEGKTWSRTYRYLSEDSSFLERFDDGRKLAAVRGTAFEVNAEKGYLRTESHAVEVFNPAGKRLATVPEGVAVSASDLSIFLSALDSAWKDSNLLADAKYSAEQLKRVKAELLAKYAEGTSALDSARRLFRGEGERLPVSLSFSGDSLVVSIPSDLSSRVKDAQAASKALTSAYEQTAAFAEDPTTVRSKEALRDAILQLSPPEKKASLATLFARHEIYDSWSEAAKWSDEELLRIRKKIREYVTEGADEAALGDLESSLPSEKIDLFNAKMESLKQRGFETLSREDLFFAPSKAVTDTVDVLKEKGAGLLKDAIDSIR